MKQSREKRESHPAFEADPLWIIDIFPQRVPPEYHDNFSPVEAYFLKEPARSSLIEKKLHFLLKLSCYKNLEVFCEPYRTPMTFPDPLFFKEMLEEQSLFVSCDAFWIHSDHEETCMELFTEDNQVPDLIRTLCLGEGLYLWRVKTGERE